MSPIRSHTPLFIRFCLCAAMAIPCKAQMNADSPRLPSGRKIGRSLRSDSIPSIGMRIVSESKANGIQPSTGEMRVYFNGSVDSTLAVDTPASGNQSLLDRLVERIDSSRFSIDMCFRNLEESKVVKALVAARNRGVRVRFICDDAFEGLKQIRDMRTAGIPVISDLFGSNAGAGTMHNKFAVFDNRDSSSFTDDRVWTGSFNLTDWGKDPAAIENAVVIQDRALAEVYTSEFEQMWGSNNDEPSEIDSRFGVLKKDDIPHTIMVAGKRIDVVMSPTGRIAEHLMTAIQTADSSAYFCMNSFTSHPIALSFLIRSQADPALRVRGVMDAKEWAQDGLSSEWNFLYGFADVLLSGEPGELHHKYLLVDADAPESDPLVATGSYGWTNKSESENDENCMIIHDASIANQYLQEFAARYRAAGGNASFPTAVEEKLNPFLPSALELFPNHPNPFNQETLIRYQIQGSRPVVLTVFDFRGRKVIDLVRENQEAGIHSVRWNGRDINGLTLSSGVYMIRIQAGLEWKTRKAILLM